MFRRRFADITLVQERLQANINARRTVSVVGAGSDCRLVENSARDILRQLLPIGGTLRVLRLGRIGKETAFHQNSRDRRSTQNEIPPPADTAIFGSGAAYDRGVNACGQRSAFRAIKICLNAAGSAARSGVEMDADKNGVRIGIGNGDPCAQRHEYVCASRHDHPVAGFLQNRF